MAALPFWRRAANTFLVSLKWMFRTFTSALTVLIAILYLLSAFSDWVNPNLLVISAYLGLFFQFSVLVALLWLLMLGLMRRWRWLFVLLLVVLLGATRLWRYCPLHIFDRDPITLIEHEDGTRDCIRVDSLRLMSFNTFALGGIKLPKGGTEVPIIEMIRHCGADIVCLQEYAFALKSGYTEERLRRMLSREYPYYRFLHNNKRDAMGVAYYSKYPLSECVRVDDGKIPYTAMAYCTANVHGRKVGIVNCYMRSFTIPKDDRALYHDMMGHFETDSIQRIGRSLRHLGEAYRIRAKEVLCLRDWIEQNHGDDTCLLIVCGDMNDTPISFTYNILSSKLTDTWCEVGMGPGISYRVAPFRFRIDHIFHSSRLRALDARVMTEETNSDHYPVVATFQLLPTDYQP